MPEKMEGSKPWYKSEGIWGGIGSIAAGAGMMYGIDPETSKEVVAMTAASGGAIIGGIMSVVGRWKAAFKIG